ncbi:response regulator [Candidatus Dojkabacteria bacterium]|nr:response regulator [Candidatus Dojkabacteria bacterium]
MKKILIVEDDTEIAQIEMDYLVADGFEVTVAADGVKAMQLFESQVFDLVILDLNLPQKDGIHVCE